MTMTLVRKRLYFGMDPLRLREAANRVLMRVPEDVTQPAVVRFDALAEDFLLGARAGRAAVDEMVEEGFLQRQPTQRDAYNLTDRFRAVARARIIEPLPRAQAQELVARFKQMAAHFNRTAARNRYEIEALAVFGSYMSTQDDLPELAIGVAGRRRSPEERPRFGRATTQSDGTAQLRALFESQSSYVQVTLLRRVHDAPRPFSVIFKADD
jgi:hypothetical protein